MQLNAEGFLALVRHYSAGVEELTPAILREFIDKVVVHHREIKQGGIAATTGGSVMGQKVDIFYKLIGKVDLPLLTPAQIERFQESFGRKKAARKAA